MIALAGLSIDFRGPTLLLILMLLAGIAWAVLAYRQTVPPTRLSLREVCDLIMKAQGNWGEVTARYF